MCSSNVTFAEIFLLKSYLAAAGSWPSPVQEDPLSAGDSRRHPWQHGISSGY